MRLCVFLIVLSSAVSSQKTYECSPERKKCEFTLFIQEKLTMIYGKNLVKGLNGELYKFDEWPSNKTLNVSIYNQACS